ncbi:DUF1707 domain-containing protein [Streptomyces sp. S.PNR 29]|uniref:DUF1707 SHOCT-like domain-containing protein n=1 Tax=Streptomyces sp. S.PNR 29 TaxID=2973805 RepID=UPI0025B1EB24|nr:DUF1707 domain-containing protein [Streptomyces sp. S.PNR 29]MDN0200361.1 DUF1707 domain-containing protein [Streptomyces sp. S.PNR 29]
MSGDFFRTAEPTELRASHADRDRVVDVLSAAAADGRLTAEELDGRVEAALSARTMGELAVLTADLPTVLGGDPVEAKEVVRIEQEGASTRRDGDWVVPRRMEIQSAWGEVTLDFTRAVIVCDTLHLDLDIRGGALKLVTRPGIVVDTDSLVTHYATTKTRHTGGADVPVVLRVEITGEISFGKVVVRQPSRRVFGRKA